MKIKIIISILLFISFLSFTVLGIFLGKTQLDGCEILTVWTWLIDLGTILSGVGTIIASYVGYLALDNWKRQSKGVSSLKRLLKNQENIAILCSEFLDRTTSVMGEEKDELYCLIKNTENNFSILSRQQSSDQEILEMKELLFMPKVRIRDVGLLWDPEKDQLRKLEKLLNQYIKNK